MTEIAFGVALYVTIVLVLVSLIQAARAWLVPGGEVAVDVNGLRVLRTRRGGKLLDCLSAHSIFVPSACGGAGTCGQCLVQVVAGGGPLLPTERTHIDRPRERAGWRLACQVPVKEDLRVEVPRECLESRRWICRVVRNDNVATFIKELVLALPAGEAVDFQPGGFVVLEAPPHDLRFSAFDVKEPYRAEWDRLDLWGLESHTGEAVQRAYSMANYPGEKGVILLNVRIATPPPGAPRETPPGRASSWLFGLKPGDEVAIRGPFGEFFIHESEAEMVYVGGGAGMAPLRSHILELLEGRRSRRKISYWYGARSLSEVFYREDFERLARAHPNFTFHLALSQPRPEDGWKGPTGFIHQVLYDHYLKAHPAPEDVEYYLCGPPMMIAAVLDLLDRLGVERENIFYDDFGGQP